MENYYMYNKIPIKLKKEEIFKKIQEIFIFILCKNF